MAVLVWGLAVASASASPAEPFENASVVRKISEASEKLEMTTNTSRILTLGKNVPRVQVNNPELVAVTPLSATDVQISAKKAGVTQVNLWDEDGKIHTIDVLIYGDARELSVALQTQFPQSSIRVYRYSESLVLTGFVDRPDHVGPIMRLAEDYAPKVINNINVGGVQQILLKVKVIDINRTKLRELGVDWGWFGGGGDFAINSVNGLISEVSTSTQSIESFGDTFSFGIISDDAAFFGVLRALQQNEVAKTLAEPNIVAVSGRPAQFVVGGEVPILIPQSLGTSSIEYKSFGTILDFLPIVLGNGNIRLEVRPQVTEKNEANGIQLNDIFVPGFNTRRVDTAVEMKAGQTFALAGLVQEKSISRNRGLPYLADVPVLGVPFRGTFNDIEEIELLIMVTPEFVDPLDAYEAPCGGPGYATTNPTNRQLYCGGQVEVPAHCNPTSGLTTCGQDPCASCSNSGCNNGNCSTCNGGGEVVDDGAFITDGIEMPGGVGYDDTSMPTIESVPPGSAGPEPATESLQPAPVELPMPEGAQPTDSTKYIPSSRTFDARAFASTDGSPHTAARPYNPPRQPVYQRNPFSQNNRQQAPTEPAENGLIGPVGYDN